MTAPKSETKSETKSAPVVPADPRVDLTLTMLETRASNSAQDVENFRSSLISSYDAMTAAEEAIKSGSDLPVAAVEEASAQGNENATAYVAIINKLFEITEHMDKLKSQEETLKEKRDKLTKVLVKEITNVTSQADVFRINRNALTSLFTLLGWNDVRMPNMPRTSSGETASASSGEHALAREWARANDIPVNDKGRVSADVLKAYRAANK